MHERKSQAYAILTMCRALYASKNGEQAALWAQKDFPEWSSLIQNALLWREAWHDENVNHDATFQETLRFVRFAISQCEKDL
jgi:predicted acyl esterase